ncbi:MAG: hypothetical protein ACP5M4_15385, partial [Acidobacteriaceae bacterium]
MNMFLTLTHPIVSTKRLAVKDGSARSAVLNEKGTQVAISLEVVLWFVEAWRYWSRFWGDCAQFALVLPT